MPTRPVPPFRRDGAYSLLVFLHAQTLSRTGWDKDPTLSDDAPKILTDAAATLDGMARYQAHPFRRNVPDAPVVWRKGSVRVLDFGGSGPPILAIPSMVNGAQIMDLALDLSPLRWLSGQGFRVFQVDWGSAPGREERGFGLGDFLEQRLMPALDAVVRLGGGPAHLIGYCMGGPLMLALAQRAADRVGRIATLGAPWDFSAFPEHQTMSERRVEIEQILMAKSLVFGVIPPQMTQSFFALRDLTSGAAKFRRFMAMEPMSAEAKRFVAVEDWLNDGIPLPPKVGQECFLDWLIDDAPRKGAWAPGGVPFDAGEVKHPALVVAAQRDTVVRRAASEPLSEALPNAQLLKASVGHIGMVVGANAIEIVWKPVMDFLRNQA